MIGKLSGIIKTPCNAALILSGVFSVFGVQDDKAFPHQDLSIPFKHARLLDELCKDWGRNMESGQLVEGSIYSEADSSV